MVPQSSAVSNAIDNVLMKMKKRRLNTLRRRGDASSERHSSINAIRFTKLTITPQWISVSLDYSNIEEGRNAFLACHVVFCLNLLLLLGRDYRRMRLKKDIYYKKTLYNFPNLLVY